jgi:quinol monooxygenase YgiN
LVLAETRAADENPIVTLVKSKVKDRAGPVGMIITFKVKEGQEKAFAEAFGPCLAATRKEPGCIAYYLSHDLDDPRVFVMFERFKSVAALEEHGKHKYVADLLGKIGPMIEGDPSVKVYVPGGE